MRCHLASSSCGTYPRLTGAEDGLGCEELVDMVKAEFRILTSAAVPGASGGASAWLRIEPMENLFAPWRMEYVAAEPDSGCLFCRVLEAPADQDRANLVVWRQPELLVMLNKFPYNNGHLMLAPRLHAGNLTDLPPVEAARLIDGVQRSLRALAAAM